MNAFLPADIVLELESAIAGCPPDRCVRMLWRTTDLLVAGRDRLREQELGVLDEVLIRLAERIEPKALVQLSTALVDLKAAPKETLRRLALDVDPTIAGPLLLKSHAIAASDLEAIAASRGEQHLLAIAGRSKIDQALTDILVKRGSKTVCRVLAKNPGARFSEEGYSMLVSRADGDSELAKTLALRPDIPDATLRTLISKAPKEVKASILDAAPAGTQERIDAPASPPTQTSAAKPRPAVDYSEARSEVTALARIGKLNDSTVNRFAIRGQRANLIASLSVLSGAPIDIIEAVIADPGYEGLAMACRASRLNWQTTLAILTTRNAPQLSIAERERAQQLFETQHLSTSQWTVRWGELAANAGAASTDRNVAKSETKR